MANNRWEKELLNRSLLSLPKEELELLLATLEKLEYPAAAPLVIRIFRLFDGKKRRPELRLEALLALRGLGGAGAVLLFRKVAWEHRGSNLGDWALEGLYSHGKPDDIPLVLKVFEDSKSCVEARITALNTLSGLVSNFPDQPRVRLAKALRRRLEDATFRAMHDAHPHVRAFGTRLAGSLQAHRDVVERLAKEDHTSFYGGETVADEAGFNLEKYVKSPCASPKNAKSRQRV